MVSEVVKIRLEVAEVFLFFVVFSCPWDVTSCRHVCFSPDSTRLSLAVLLSLV